MWNMKNPSNGTAISPTITAQTMMMTTEFTSLPDFPTKNTIRLATKATILSIILAKKLTKNR